MRTFTYVVCVIVLFLWGQAEAQVLNAPEALGITPNEAFRYVFSGLLGVLIWIARGTDARIKGLETYVTSARLAGIDRDSRLQNVEKQAQVLDNEHKNTLSLVMMQRELLLTKYHDKEDAEKHREKIELLLGKHHDLLTKICTRLDDLSKTEKSPLTDWNVHARK